MTDGIVVHYDVTRPALTEALAALPTGTHLTAEARARQADTILAQLPAVPCACAITRGRLADALTRLDVRVLAAGPAAGMINAESMAGAILEALAGVSP